MTNQEKQEMQDTQSEFITANEVQQKFKISRPTEILWRKKGILPKPLKMGRLVYYRSAEIMKL